MTVSGYVIDGGDTTPEGLVDVPRIFKYRIEREDGSIIFITYTAYPPSPSGDESKKFRLKFHAGEIQIEDLLQARGIYDQQTNTLIITEEGHFIETYQQKPWFPQKIEISTGLVGKIHLLPKGGNREEHKKHAHNCFQLIAGIRFFA